MMLHNQKLMPTHRCLLTAMILTLIIHIFCVAYSAKILLPNRTDHFQNVCGAVNDLHISFTFIVLFC